MTVTATGLQIGRAYRPPPAAFDRDAQRLQTALLDARTATPPPMWRRILGVVWDWL